MEPWYNSEHKLTEIGLCTEKHEWILIPATMHREMLDKIYQGCQGMTKYFARAQQSMWWLGLSRDIKEGVERCDVRCQYSTYYTEPLLTTPLPARSWQTLAADIFQWGKGHYLFVIDYFSTYIEVANHHNCDHSRETESHLHQIWHPKLSSLSGQTSRRSKEKTQGWKRIKRNRMDKDTEQDSCQYWNQTREYGSGQKRQLKIINSKIMQCGDGNNTEKLAQLTVLRGLDQPASNVSVTRSGRISHPPERLDW